MDNTAVNSIRRRDRRIYCVILLLSFALILVLNLLTPMLSDDYSYGLEVRQASAPADLIAQEYNQYMTWNGRSIAHLLLRMFLWLPAPVFKLANALAFVAVGVLMAGIARPGKRYDWFALLLSHLLLWLCSVDLSETILWEDGACNYLWGAMFILLFMSLEQRVDRRLLTFSGKTAQFLSVIGLFLLGLVAGWCNENTSGGCLLFLLWLFIRELRDGHGVRPQLISGGLGCISGFLLMVLSPGARIRASYETDENYSGLLGLLSRFQKITLNVETYFAALLAVLLVCIVVLCLQKRCTEPRGGADAAAGAADAALVQTFLFLFLSAATAYALILSRPTQPRALFGAGLFLDIALITAVCAMTDHEQRYPESGTGIMLRVCAYGGMAVMTLQFFFSYADNGTNLARVWRDERTRVSYIEEQAAQGSQEIIVPLIHTDFYNDYSAISKMEMTDDPDYWINVIYEEYYGVDSIIAIDYDEWEMWKAEQ